MAQGQGIFPGIVTGLLLLVATDASAGERLTLTDASFLEVDSGIKSAQGRPNEQSRLAGHKAYLRRDYGAAISHFERGAFYADKFSQHSLSLMYWHGVGVAPDPVQAYIWADLAAERGSKSLLLIRERMWADLGPAQREQAKAKGLDFYARYGDDVAQPRAEGAMRRFADDMTGSRVRFDGHLLDIVGAPMGGTYAPQMGSMASTYQNSPAASKEQLYGGDRRDMVAYWTGQTRLLDGKVNVGQLTPVRP